MKVILFSPNFAFPSLIEFYPDKKEGKIRSLWLTGIKYIFITEIDIRWEILLMMLVLSVLSYHKISTHCVLRLKNQITTRTSFSLELSSLCPPVPPLSCGNISTQLYFIIRFLHQINDCPGSGWIFNIYMLGSRVCIIPYIILCVMYTTHTISFHHKND